MKTIKYLVIFCALFTLIKCQDDFLERPPKGIATDELLATPANVEKMIIAAYAAQTNERYYLRPLNPWPYGDLRSGDAYKGGAGIGDLPEWNTAETFINMTQEESGIAGKWEVEYQCISRANQALQLLHLVDYPQKNTRIAEMRFLRANNYFWLKVNFRYVPYIDESVDVADYGTIGNDLTDEQLWGKIIEDFQFAVDNLPAVHADGAVGRPTKYAAQAYLAKVLLYAAYEQDQNNQLVNINRDKLVQVLTLCDIVLGESGKDLFEDFALNFECAHQNGIESIWAIQFSRGDGIHRGLVDGTNFVTYPMVAQYGCCGYHCPSQNLVNAFRTVNGLPDFDNFNEIEEEWNATTVLEHTIDPRMLHTVAMTGLPYKYKPDFIYDGVTWTRQPEIYGPYMTMKGSVRYDDPCYFDASPWKGSSKNRDVLKINDVILWKAEALIQLDRESEALPLINQIRARAAQSTDLLVDINEEPTGNFDIALYEDGVNCTWTKDFAFKALNWERRLEFATEGFRAYDLLRWGIMAETLNEYFDVERNRREHLSGSSFMEGRDEYLPIPKGQIDLSQGLYKQNVGY